MFETVHVCLEKVEKRKRKDKREKRKEKRSRLRLIAEV